MYQKVKWVLNEYPETRKSDNLLILKIIENYDPSYEDKSFDYVLRNTKLSFESITRARRRVQKENPELFDFKTMVKREEKEQEYREYYR